MKILQNILFSLTVAITALTSSDSANAFERLGLYSDTDSLAEISRSKPNALSLAPLMTQLSQSDNVRSRSDVISEVKRRYNAEVLRIKLNKKRMVYEVRVLMPNGKVKNITVSARR